MTDINTHGLICDFGRHRDVPYTRIPISYLKWLANTPDHRAHEIAKAELKRRGTTTPDLDVSGHAIDSASLRCRRTWHQTRRHEEGLHAWLCRVAAEALERGDRKDDGRVYYMGIKFVFEQDGVWPVLKTVMATKKGGQHEEGKGAAVSGRGEGEGEAPQLAVAGEGPAERREAGSSVASVQQPRGGSEELAPPWQDP